MISEEQIELLSRSFKRVFALPISQMTLREVQNVIGTTFPGNQELASAVYGSLLSGEVQESLKKGNNSELDNLLENYSTHVRFAKEVAETGEFMNIFSCDFFQKGNQVFFVNRMRRIDGTEYYFLSAPDTNIRLAHMFINRVRDLKKQAGSEMRLNPAIREELEKLNQNVVDLLSQ